MSINIGAVDRALRILAGLGLIAWALGLIPGWSANVWGWIGVVPFLTGIVGYCPAYSIFGVSTCGRTRT